MPIIHIHLMEGRPPELLESLIRDVSRTASETLGSPIENVRVVVNEMQPHQFGIGGRPHREAAAERRARSEGGAQGEAT